LTVYIGTSGWQYRHWRHTFYPQGVAQARWLEFFCERFQIVELNNSFYSLPKEETFAKWRDRTPDDFIMAAKMSRYLTHIKKLQDPEEPVQRFFSRARALGDKLGPVLIQLPPTLKVDIPALDETLSLIPDGVRVSVEFRHDSWWTDEVRAVLEKHGAANCLADRGSKPITELWKTTDWTFLRFHAGVASPPPCYHKRTLQEWMDRLQGQWGPDEDIYVFFNNDPRACALRDAVLFAQFCDEAGYPRTRVPSRRDITVGDIDSAAWAVNSPLGAKSAGR
jgi:uncharacterized protein YecE (DUF72 family)